MRERPCFLSHVDLVTSRNSLHLTTFLHSICSFFREEKVKSVVLKDILLYFYYDKKPVVFVGYLFYSFFSVYVKKMNDNWLVRLLLIKLSSSFFYWIIFIEWIFLIFLKRNIKRGNNKKQFTLIDIFGSF